MEPPSLRRLASTGIFFCVLYVLCGQLKRSPRTCLRGYLSERGYWAMSSAFYFPVPFLLDLISPGYFPQTISSPSDAPLLSFPSGPTLYNWKVSPDSVYVNGLPVKGST